MGAGREGDDGAIGCDCRRRALHGVVDHAEGRLVDHGDHARRSEDCGTAAPTGVSHDAGSRGSNGVDVALYHGAGIGLGRVGVWDRRGRIGSSRALAVSAACRSEDHECDASEDVAHCLFLQAWGFRCYT